MSDKDEKEISLIKREKYRSLLDQTIEQIEDGGKLHETEAQNGAIETYATEVHVPIVEPVKKEGLFSKFWFNLLIGLIVIELLAIPYYKSLAPSAMSYEDAQVIFNKDLGVFSKDLEAFKLVTDTSKKISSFTDESFERLVSKINSYFPKGYSDGPLVKEGFKFTESGFYYTDP
ncbi:MAG: hypothetical protein D6808_08050 [Candidatus Dadabacteria bacterium]|nr:MAG: hypothetical protein D6808_08050 [Candidatus Dadabacteria bacterium]